MNPLIAAESTIGLLHLLVVSKESSVLRSLRSVGEKNRWHVEAVPSGWDAMDRLQSGVLPELMLLDLPQGDGEGLHMLRWVRRLNPNIPVVALCYPEDTATRKEAASLGAAGVLCKPIDEKQIESEVRRHLGLARDVGEEVLTENVEKLDEELFFVSASPAMRKLRAQAELLAQADVPVFIVGENGAGKDAVARLIHKLSVRRGSKFLKLNCASSPAELLENELFGSSRVFSYNPVQPNPGRFASAANGTIFLSEITEMPDGLQVRLLKALQNSELDRRKGESAPSADVRIVASTSANLEVALADKKLREDLYYRLSAFTVRVPPLRQRREETAILLRYAIHKLAKRHNLPAREVSSTMLAACQQYPWPGNLTELEAFVKRYLVSSDPGLTPNESDSDALNNNHENSDSSGMSGLPVSFWSGDGSEKTETAPKSLRSFIQSIKSEAERNAIAAALEQTGWNRKAAARLLKVSYRTLLYKIEQYQMTSAAASFSATSIATAVGKATAPKEVGK